MEAVKGIIFDRGPTVIEGKDVHAYLVTMVLVTDTPLPIKDSATIVMGNNLFNQLSDGLRCLPRYEPPYKLGDTNAIVQVSNMNPNDLERIK